MKIVLLIACFITFSLQSNAQSYKETNSVQTINHTIIIQEEGTLKLVYEWTDQILKKNQNFENIDLLISDTDKDTLNLLVVYTYKSELIRSTNEINQE